MSFRIRRARRSDLPAALKLVASDAPLFTAHEWRLLPSLLADSIEQHRVQLCVVEDGDAGTVLFLGGSAFINPGHREEIVGHPSGSALSVAFRLQRLRGTAFLNRRQVAEANRQRTLVLLNFFGTTHGLVAAGVSRHVAVSLATETWTFFHGGFSFREIIIETADPTQADVVRNIPARLLRQRQTASGRPTWMFHITEEDARLNPAGWPFGVMVPDTPQFQFTATQQQVLELALLDFSDREVLHELGLTEDSLKKRWRAIYRRASALEPAMFEHHTGGDLRRALLQRLRHSLCELRPYR